MSNKMISLVYESALSRSEKAILLAIADYANDDGEGCYAGIDRLVYKTSYDRRQIIRIVNDLQEKGILVLHGRHPKYGTNVWTIVKEKIPAQPPFAEWRRLEAARLKNAPAEPFPPCDIMSHENSKLVGADVTLCHMPCDTMSHGDVTSCHPIPITTSDYKNELPLPEISQNGSAGAKASPADAGIVGLVADDDPWNEAAVPAQAVQKDYLSENRDDEYERGDPDGDDDPKAAHQARTPLEQKIAQLTHSKYLTDAQRAKLSSPVSASYGKQLPQEYGSPESEWRANPKLFSEYVEMCAKLISNGSGRQPSRSALITTMRNYARSKSGWIFFKDFKEQAAAPAKQVQKQYYHNPATPSWRA